jgi:phosphonate transport system substrate-binding protein
MKKISVAVVLLVLLGLAGTVYAGGVIKVGIAAMVSPKETEKYYTQMLNYIGEKTGMKVEIIQRENYDEMDTLLEKGNVNIAFVCSGPYVNDKKKFGAELLVAPQSYGKPFYNAYIIAPVDSSARGIGDLRGKKFAFTDPKSNTGKIVPTYMIAKKFHESSEKFFSQTIYTRSHDKSIEAVAKKLVDGASVDSLIYDYTARKNPVYTKLTRIIEKSPLYGIPPVVVNKTLDSATKAKIRDAFLNMNKDAKGRAILAGIMVDKFIVPKDSDYNTVREMDRFITAHNK